VAILLVHLGRRVGVQLRGGHRAGLQGVWLGVQGGAGGAGQAATGGATAPAIGLIQELTQPLQLGL